MRKPVRFLLVAALALLAGCPLEGGDATTHHAYLGLWKIDSCSGGFSGTRDCGAGDPGAIELFPDRYDEYRQGALFLSAAATYLVGQTHCPGDDQVTLQVDSAGRFDWCLTFGDGERLDACDYGIPDGNCWHFRRCEFGDFC